MSYTLSCPKGNGARDTEDHTMIVVELRWKEWRLIITISLPLF